MTSLSKKRYKPSPYEIPFREVENPPPISYRDKDEGGPNLSLIRKNHFIQKADNEIQELILNSLHRYVYVGTLDEYGEVICFSPRWGRDALGNLGYPPCWGVSLTRRTGLGGMFLVFSDSAINKETIETREEYHLKLLVSKPGQER